MKIEQIQYILEIYKTGSISKAAQNFYMSRPNLSNSIRNLENEVGFDILERGLIRRVNQPVSVPEQRFLELFEEELAFLG